MLHLPEACLTKKITAHTFKPPLSLLLPQVELLQTAFTSLADAVLEELGECSALTQYAVLVGTESVGAQIWPAAAYSTLCCMHNHHLQAAIAPEHAQQRAAQVIRPVLTCVLQILWALSGSRHRGSKQHTHSACVSWRTGYRSANAGSCASKQHINAGGSSLHVQAGCSPSRCAVSKRAMPAEQVSRPVPLNRTCSTGVKQHHQSVGMRLILAVLLLHAAVAQSKLSALGRLEERLDVKLAIAAELPGQFEGLAKQQAAGECAVDALTKDIKVSTAAWLPKPVAVPLQQQSIDSISHMPAAKRG